MFNKLTENAHNFNRNFKHVNN